MTQAQQKVNRDVEAAEVAIRNNVGKEHYVDSRPSQKELEKKEAEVKHEEEKNKRIEEFINLRKSIDILLDVQERVNLTIHLVKNEGLATQVNDISIYLDEVLKNLILEEHKQFLPAWGFDAGVA